MSSLDGRIAIVTGSSRGIGRAIAEQLDLDGASVVVNYGRSRDEAHRVVAGIEANGGKAIAIQADVSVVADIRRLFRETIAKFGHVDIAVNNAGPGGTPRRVAEISEEEFDSMFSGFARGPFFLMQEAARNLADHRRVINISSAITLLLPPFTSTYAGAKAAMEALSAVLAAELAPRGVSVNVVAPGAIQTKMLRDLPNEFQDVLAQRTRLGIVKPRDIGGIVAYLAGDRGDWIANEKLRSRQHSLDLHV